MVFKLQAIIEINESPKVETWTQEMLPVLTEILMAPVSNEEDFTVRQRYKKVVKALQVLLGKCQ